MTNVIIPEKVLQYPNEMSEIGATLLRINDLTDLPDDLRFIRYFEKIKLDVKQNDNNQKINVWIDSLKKLLITEKHIADVPMRFWSFIFSKPTLLLEYLNGISNWSCFPLLKGRKKKSKRVIIVEQKAYFGIDETYALMSKLEQLDLMETFQKSDEEIVRLKLDPGLKQQLHFSLNRNLSRAIMS